MPLAGEQLHQDHQGARPPQPPQMPFPPSQQNRADNGDLYELLTPPDCNIQGLTKLSALVNLNLSNNFISQLTNLAHLPNLHTFSVSRLLKVHVTMSEILRAENSYCFVKMNSYFFYAYSLFDQEQAEDQRGYPGVGKLQEAFSPGHLLQLAGGAGRAGGVGQDA